MRIALISYEFSIGLADGGIGTYMRQAASMLSDRGHSVEVFTSSHELRENHTIEPFRVHRVDADRNSFSEAVVAKFISSHKTSNFDVIEGPEFGSDAALIAAEFPELPLVVKLHAPAFTIGLSNSYYIGWRKRLRYAIGALRRGQWPKDPWRYDPMLDPERTHARSADEVVANSRATASRVAAAWKLDSRRLSVVPCPFEPTTEIMAIDPSSHSKTVLFFGRIEARKGVLELASAIPRIATLHPDARFRFVGRILPHPADGRLLTDHISERAGSHADRIEVSGPVPYDEISNALSTADIVVLPSDWEAMGYACLEAMAAARGVIGSSSGGMSELIDSGQTGLLVSPRSPKGIVEAVCDLLANPERRIEMGRAARASVANCFNADVIMPLQEASYERAIANVSRRDPAIRYS